MINHEELINNINDSCKYLFTSQIFKLEENVLSNSAKTYRIQGNSKALNRKKNDIFEVSVLNWFEDFYLYVEVKFVSNHTFISLSVFKGADNQLNKHQLFRAEWDDYDRDDEIHAQPHWHITTDVAISDNFNNFLGEKEQVTFDVFELSKAEVFDIKNFHFAMLGNWQQDETHIHKISEPAKVSKWLLGVLKHIRVELDV
ncbi:hypothetical protein [Chryseobacterium caseinilyticum]|uniref:Uncharacterized protein n=1 Tax=Chryseobacterium caseinilyticum TaxID=2771428 RepID=A0ABR8ZEJ4_9FLAO|nr:hypothetical protein [Chryseobacterium caseinilyticum]MBD8083489.1 hypothetical protein [Chryseobacterium caseinilyticum]